MLAVATDAGLTCIQLHGDEDASAYVDTPLPVIKALPVGEGFSLSAVEDLPARVTPLLDAHDPARRGGTGRIIEWTVAATAARLRPVILSGGLTPDNVKRRDGGGPPVRGRRVVGRRSGARNQGRNQAARVLRGAARS